MTNIIHFKPKEPKEALQPAEVAPKATFNLKSMQACTVDGLVEFISQFGTPYMIVNEELAGDCGVPKHVFKNGEVTLNIATYAVSKWQHTESHLMFKCRFGGVDTQLCIPYTAIIAVFPKENASFAFTFPTIEIQVPV